MKHARTHVVRSSPGRWRRVAVIVTVVALVVLSAYGLGLPY